LALLSGWQIIALYSFYARSYSDVYCFIYPGNMTYLSQQLVNGINIGLIYALMAVGLTLIYSVQGIVSFTHAQFYMLGGYCSYWLLEVGTNRFGVDINPLLGIPVAAVATFLIGSVFERLLLRPMHLGKVERIHEYAILITFGFGFFLESFVLSTQGPLPVKVGRYLDVRRIELVLTADRERVLGPIRFLGDRTFTALIGVALILALMYFFRRTWTGRALRAVSMDKQAAAVAGINPLNMNTLAFGLGAMLAGISGAALIPIFNFVPWIGQVNAGRAYIIVVLGGLGSIPGALIGGIIIGLVETMGSGCLVGGDRAAAYKDVYGLLIFVLVLLIKPTGLFGREQL
jgi:branched-chain amino acid transport system permease protein